MRHLPWFILVIIFGSYITLVSIFTFAGPIANTIHFLRLTVIMAVLVMYIPYANEIFKTSPAPSRDYLYSGIILMALSNELFSTWNEAGRIWGVDTNVFTGPVSGFFSLVVMVGGIAWLKAADEESTNRWIYALIIAVIFGFSLVFIAPQFR